MAHVKSGKRLMPAVPALPDEGALPPWLLPQLTGLMSRRAHALLLDGPAGLGQWELALALASARLCEAPGSAGACGSCPSCALLASRTHPDLLLLAPEVQLLAWDWPMGEKQRNELDSKERKPSKDIRVEALRAAIEFCQRTSARGRAKVVLVYPAERMNHVSANALLKTLEEPAVDQLFILASEAAHLLLPTIRSRCQSHQMVWPQAAQARSWLQTRHPQAADLYDVCGQKPALALALAHAGECRADWAVLPLALLHGRLDAFERFSPPELVSVLQKVCHDLWRHALGVAPRFFDVRDLPGAPVRLAALQAWSHELQQQAKVAEHPYSAALFVQALVARGHSAVNSRP
jgi:DNA polymerase III subunit delta'